MKTAQHIAFTICSNNYMGQALALKTSFLKHNPNYIFYIILVDKLSDKVEYTTFAPAIILPISEVEGVDLEDLISRYYIIELNTSVKPSAFKNLIKRHPEARSIYYLDPDLYFYDSLTELDTKLESKAVVLTPHILTPIPRDGKLPNENIFLRFGIYNLGFIGINSQNSEALTMLDWWEERVIRFGYDRPHKGYFVDQLWMTHAPLFFEDIVILNSYKYNMAPWNLHERRVMSIDGDSVQLNDNSRLCFYHFSKLSEDEDAVSREYDRYTLTDFPLLKQLYSNYKMILTTCGYAYYKTIPIAYPVKMSLVNEQGKVSLVAKVLKKVSKGLNLLANKI